MKKSLRSIVAGFLVFGACWNVWAESSGGGLSLGHTAEDVQCNGCVNDTDIATAAVTEPKLATGAVTNGKIAGGAITNNKISDGAITETKIVDGAVTSNKLADWSISGSKIVDFSVTDTKILSNAVTAPKIADGAVTDAKITGPISGSKLGSHSHDGAGILDGAVTTSKISDGAVTDVKITGPISASKVEKLANVIVVAKSGGDFTSIQAAIDSINPTAENPYLIKVMPGTYVESITMKSYIHLQGAGRDVTTISGGVDIHYAAYVTVSKLAISGGGVQIAGDLEGGSAAFITITDCLITGSGNGITINQSDDSIIIHRNIIRGNWWCGIFVVRYAQPRIVENVIEKNYYGLWSDGWAGEYPIRGNTITSNGAWGLYLGGSPIILYNEITGNGETPDITGGGDIYMGGGMATNISFNVFNSHLIGCCGSSIRFNYNVKSDGSPAP